MIYSFGNDFIVVSFLCLANLLDVQMFLKLALYLFYVARQSKKEICLMVLKYIIQQNTRQASGLRILYIVQICTVFFFH